MRWKLRDLPCWMDSWCGRQRRPHGTGRRIEGFHQADAPVIIVDDVCTTGRSTVAAIEAAREAGMRVIAVILPGGAGRSQRDDRRWRQRRRVHRSIGLFSAEDVRAEHVSHMAM